MANEALLRPLPMREPDRLVRVWDRGREGGNRAMSPAAWAALRHRRDVFESVGGSADIMSTLTGHGEPESILGYRFAAGFFETLGVAPALGRTFSAEDDRPGAPPVVVLSHRLWQRRLGGDPGVVGKALTLSGRAHTVIGVMPRGFVHPPTVELWVPLALEPAAIENPRARFVRTVARLREGVGLDAARRAVDEVSRRLLAEKPEAVHGGGLRLETMDEDVRGDARTPVLALLGAVGFVLLVACANVAGLSLGRAATRRRDLAVRVALGASRARLVGEALVETALLAAVGGALGLLLAWWASGFLPALFPSTIANLSLPKVESVPVGLPVALFAAAATTLAALVAGAAPALHAAFSGPSESLQSSSRSVAGDRRRVLPLIVASEVGLALVLLVGAGLLLRSFLYLRGGDAGFDPANVVTGRLILTGERYDEPERVRTLHDGVLARLRATPGVEAVGFRHLPPHLRLERLAGGSPRGRGAARGGPGTRGAHQRRRSRLLRRDAPPAPGRPRVRRARRPEAAVGRDRERGAGEGALPRAARRRGRRPPDRIRPRAPGRASVAPGDRRGRGGRAAGRTRAAAGAHGLHGLRAGAGPVLRVGRAGTGGPCRARACAQAGGLGRGPATAGLVPDAARVARVGVAGPAAG